MDLLTIDDARAGNERAFAELVEPYRRELHLHCYRMVGSLADAEDLLQETLLAAWRGIGGFAGRSSLRTWLYRIATNRCLNLLRDGRRRVPAEPVAPFTPPAPTRRSEVTWVQPYPDTMLGVAGPESDPVARYTRGEVVELAFVTALQALPPRQTAVLVLCDVLGFSRAEAAEMLDVGLTTVKALLQRARESIARTRSGPGPAHRPGSPEQERDLARRFAEAFSNDDIDGLLRLLTDDAWLAMPPAPHEYHGAVAIREFLVRSTTWRPDRRHRLVATRANGQPAFGCYLDEYDPPFTGIIVLTHHADRLAGVTRFLDPGLGRVFGMPAEIDVPRRPQAGSSRSAARPRGSTG